VKATFLVYRRTLLLAALVAAVCLTALAVAGPAMAKEKSCAEQIVDDWYDNQRVDHIYPLHCYREAIASLPPDIKDYSNAPDAIHRALLYAQAGENDPGPGGGAQSGGGRGPLPSGLPYKAVAYRSFFEHIVPIDAGPTTSAAGPSTSTSGPSSVPIPLIVLAGLAGVLLIAGGAGYVARRMQSRRGGPPPAT
jgi:hypothetical protein